jgi:hypothetical protein
VRDSRGVCGWGGDSGNFVYSRPPCSTTAMQHSEVLQPWDASQTFYDLPDVDVDIPPGLHDNDFYSDHARPFTAPFGNVHHSNDDDMMCDDTEARPTHVSHDKAIGKKRQLAASSSPSPSPPPPDPPSPFTIPQKSSTPFYNSRAAFGAQKPSSHAAFSAQKSSSCGMHRRPLSISSPMSHSILHRRHATHHQIIAFLITSHDTSTLTRCIDNEFSRGECQCWHWQGWMAGSCHLRHQTWYGFSLGVGAGMASDTRGFSHADP